MPKIDSAVVVKMMQEIILMAEGITETIRIGDDGFERSCTDQVAAIKTAIQLFILENATPKTPRAAVPEYVARHDRIMQDPRWREMPVDHGDAMVIYRSELFAFILRNLSSIPDLSDIHPHSLSTAIENHIILTKEPYTSQFLSNEWYYTIAGVVKDVVERIALLRKKNPQVKLNTW